MAQCEKTEKCQFFNDRMENMPAAAPALKELFCKTDKEGCARYQVSTAGHPVPLDLFPHMAERAKGILGCG